MRKNKRFIEIENEEWKNFIIQGTSANEGITIDNKITFEDWYINDEFQSGNVKISDDTKAYIDKLIKRIIGDKKIKTI